MNAPREVFIHECTKRDVLSWMYQERYSLMNIPREVFIHECTKRDVLSWMHQESELVRSWTQCQKTIACKHSTAFQTLNFPRDTHSVPDTQCF